VAECLTKHRGSFNLLPFAKANMCNIKLNFCKEIFHPKCEGNAKHFQILSDQGSSCKIQLLKLYNHLTDMLAYLLLNHNMTILYWFFSNFKGNGR
jgi:hypothetical protein